jgi:hypothetical protein
VKDWQSDMPTGSITGMGLLLAVRRDSTVRFVSIELEAAVGIEPAVLWLLTMMVVMMFWW